MWTVARNGSDVQVCDVRGEVIAVVGSAKDYRLNKKVKNAELMAMAPEMLEVLIDIQELFKHEYFIEDHPILDSIYSKCNELINRSLKTTEIHNARNNNSRDDRGFNHRPRGGYARFSSDGSAEQKLTDDCFQGGAVITDCNSGHEIQEGYDGSGKGVTNHCVSVFSSDTDSSTSGNIPY